MTFSLKKYMNKNSTTAEVVDGHLILSAPDAIEPIVWRMSLEKIGTASFEIKQDAKSDKTSLILKPKKGAAEVIAPFSSKEEAIDALMCASHAMQYKSNATQSPDKVNRMRQPNESSQKWIIAILGTFIVLGLYYYLSSIMPQNIYDITPANQSVLNTSSPQDATGVPVSADDFLNGL